jgi:hypothetical protein
MRAMAGACRCVQGRVGVAPTGGPQRCMCPNSRCMGVCKNSVPPLQNKLRAPKPTPSSLLKRLVGVEEWSGGKAWTCEPLPSCWGAIDGPAVPTLSHRRSGWLGRPDHRAPRQKMCLQQNWNAPALARRSPGSGTTGTSTARRTRGPASRSCSSAGWTPPSSQRYVCGAARLFRGLCDSWAPLGAGVPVFLHLPRFFVVLVGLPIIFFIRALCPFGTAAIEAGGSAALTRACAPVAFARQIGERRRSGTAGTSSRAAADPAMSGAWGSASLPPSLRTAPVALS